MGRRSRPTVAIIPGEAIGGEQASFEAHLPRNLAFTPRLTRPPQSGPASSMLSKSSRLSWPG